MYSHKTVVAVKVGGKILREYGDTVFVPFGSEYSLLIKNLNSVRLKVKVSVDGTDATDGTELVVYQNSQVELERFIRNGNWSTGNRFKFIERTAQIEEHRGIKADDGIIRVECQTEKVIPAQQFTYWPPVERRNPIPHPWDRRRPPYERRVSSRSLHPSASSGPPSSAFLGASQCNVSMAGGASAYVAQNMSDAGITVAGSQSNQQFHGVPDFPTEAGSDVIVLHLRGRVGNEPVAQARTVDIKPTCPSCGHVNSGMNKFCSQCGTGLVLY